MKKLILTILLLTSATILTAAPSLKQQADKAYADEKFAQAAKLYTRIHSEGESADICYNLACCYYRMDDMAHAVLWFERASRLNPGDEDIRFNLDMARSKTVDRITPRHEMFIITGWRSIRQSLSITQWAYLGIIAFILMLSLFALYLYSRNIILRKSGFFASLLMLLLCIISNVFAYDQRQYNNTHAAAIIMQPAVTVRSTPSASGTSLFVIHEGTRVEILDGDMKQWAEIQIADGKVGWVEKTSLEEI